MYTNLKNITRLHQSRSGNYMRYYSQLVGFIGLGNMGSRMARNLIDKDVDLTVFDLSSTAMKEFSKNIVNKTNHRMANNISDIARNCESIITMLTNGETVSAVYTNDIIPNCKEGSLLIDCSTIDPTTSQRIASAANKKSCFFDAPVSGGVAGAEAGTLTFMVGGEKKELLNEVEKLLLKMGSRVVYCGTSGTGQTAKLCNNMLLGATMISVAECMNLGIRNGLDADVLSSIINTSSGRCWASEVNPPVPGTKDNVPSSRDYQGGFKTDLMLKDMKLAIELAAQTKTPVELGKLATRIFQNVSEEGLGGLDFSVVYKYLTNINKK